MPKIIRKLRLVYLIMLDEPTLKAAKEDWDDIEDGIFISAEKTQCDHAQAATFDSEEAARAFFFSIEEYRHLKFKLKKLGTLAPELDVDYPADHPISILAAIKAQEPKSVYQIAYAWFHGETCVAEYDEQDWKQSRQALLRYGINIMKPAPDEMQIKQEFDFSCLNEAKQVLRLITPVCSKKESI